MKSYVRIAVAAFAAMGLSFAASAQDFPTRNITMIVPYPAGGPTDQAARVIGPKLAEKLGQNVVIENVSGGGTTIAIGRVARSAPDGYTLLMHNLQISANVTLYPNTPYDTVKDLTALGFVNRTPLVIVGRNGLPANNLKELVAWMKKTPAKFAYPGPGSTGHLATSLFAQAVGVKVDFIPYRGAAPAMTDIVGGHVDLFFASPASAIQPVRAKQMKIFGVASGELSTLFPDVPILTKEFGPQLDIQFWHSLFAPAGTPKPVLEKINKALIEILADAAIAKAWETQGVTNFPAAQQQLAGAQAHFLSEVARWGKVIKDNDITVSPN